MLTMRNSRLGTGGGPALRCGRALPSDHNGADFSQQCLTIFGDSAHSMLHVESASLGQNIPFRGDVHTMC